MPLHRLALLVLAVAFAWLVYDPALRSGLVFFVAFVFWSVSLARHIVVRAMGEGRRALNRIESRVLGLPVEEEGAEPADPALLPLAHEFRAYAGDPVLGGVAARARRQLQLLPEVQRNLEGLLAQKLNPEELTFARYREAGRGASATVRRELEEVAARLRGVFSPSAGPRASILHLIARELFPRRYGDAPSAHRSPELDKLRDDQVRHAEGLLARNEEALAELVRMNIAISRMKGISGRDDASLQRLLAELDDLSQRAAKY